MKRAAPASQRKWATVLLLCLALGVPARALTRLAVIFGNNTGSADDQPLQYADRDARQFQAALAQLGGVDKGGSYLLLNLPVAKVKAALEESKERIRALRGRGEKVQLIVYYSGHGDGEALHLNGESLPLAWIRGFFGEVAADVKILVADACYSGSLLSSKGAALREAAPVHYVDELRVNGSAILTSSSAGELSQESRDLQGSLFTHHFLTALRGAADFDHDRQVTLWEAYNYTQAAVRRRLALGGSPPQNPEFEMALRGSDGVILTRLDQGRAFLSLRGLPRGRYRILDAVNSLPVAEVEVFDAEGMVLALPRAPYHVYRTAGGQVSAAYADLRENGTVEMAEAEFRASAPAGLYAKGQVEPPRPAGEGARYRFSLQPRLYSGFPGREGRALAWAAAAQGDLGKWGLGLSLGYLPRYRSGSGGDALTQEGLGAAGEARYRCHRSRLGALFLGPRLEGWMLAQSVGGTSLGRGRLLGSLWGLGWETALSPSLWLSLSGEAGWFWSYDPAGELRRDPVFPMALAIRFGP